MPVSPVTIALPTADRRLSHRFYRDGLGLEPFGEPADDGVPEPLQFVLNEGVRIMLIPTGGFDWITGDNQVAPHGHSEGVINVNAGTERGVGEMLEGAEAANASIIAKSGQQPWGYSGSFADPDGHI